MRMRKMKNLEPRMERCADYRITEPAQMQGKWRSLKENCKIENRKMQFSHIFMLKTEENVPKKTQGAKNASIFTAFFPSGYIPLEE